MCWGGIVRTAGDAARAALQAPRLAPRIPVPPGYRARRELCSRWPAIAHCHTRGPAVGGISPCAHEQARVAVVSQVCPAEPLRRTATTTKGNTRARQGSVRFSESDPRGRAGIGRFSQNSGVSPQKPATRPRRSCGRRIRGERRRATATCAGSCCVHTGSMSAPACVALRAR